MASGGYQSLRTAKAAFDEGLLDENDVRQVRTAFLRAQQIRAGLDAGFIRESDYEAVKSAFLNSLNMAADPTSLRDALPASNLESDSTTAPSSLDGRQSPQPAFRPPPHNGSSGQHQQPTASLSTAQAADLHSRNGTSRPGAAPAAAPLTSTGAAPKAPPPAAMPPSAASKGRTLIPTDIPKLGGARPKQTGSTSMSGISVTEDAVNLYYYLKAKSVYRWALWRINDAGNQVVIAEVGDKESDYQEFLSRLPPADCRYGVIDMRFVNSEGCVFNKILFINWAPDTAKIKAKMMYASTKDFFKGYLDGLSIELQGSDLDDVSEQEANNAVRSSVTRQ